jgi:hypothetical protein
MRWMQSVSNRDARGRQGTSPGRIRSAGVAALAIGIGIGAAPATGAVLAEWGDAGDLPETAQISATVDPSSTPLDAITGTIEVDDDQDMFEIFISDPANFSATTTNAQTGVEDTMLYVFDADGRGVVANDDTSLAVYTSTLPAGSITTPAGVYYLAVSLLFNSPVSASGDIFELNELEASTTAVGPNGAGGSDPIDGWDVFAFVGPGTYQIDLTGATFALPEPSMALMLDLGALCLAGFATQKRRRAAQQ